MVALTPILKEGKAIEDWEEFSKDIWRKRRPKICPNFAFVGRECTTKGCPLSHRKYPRGFSTEEELKFTFNPVARLNFAYTRRNMDRIKDTKVRSSTYDDPHL